MPQNLPKSPLEQFNSDFINQMPEAEIQLQGQSALDEFNRQFFGQNQEQQERQKSFALEDTYEANGQKDASTLAKDARIQNESGVDPSEVALSFPKRAELMRTLGMTPEEFTRRYPRLTRGFIDDSTMLAIAKNDIDKFRKLEDTLREIAPDIDDEGATTGWDSNRMAYEADTKTWLAGSIQGAVGNLGSGLLGAMQFLTESAYETTDARWLRDLSQGIKETQGELKTWADDQFRAGTTGFGTDVSGTLSSLVASGVQSGFMSTVTFATGIGLAALVAATGGTAAPAIALWANLGLMGLTSFGNAYSEGKQQGLSTLAAGGHGLAQGGLEVATELLPQKFLRDAIGPKAILKNLTPENKKFVQNAMKYAFSDLAGEQVNTVLGELESWAVLPENQDKTFIDFLAELPQRQAETFVATLIGSGVTVSAGAVISNTLNNVEGTLANRMGRDFIRQNEAVKGMAIIKTIEDIATNAEVANVAPEMLPGLISKAVGDGIETAYLDSQVFYQMPELKAQIVDVAPELANSIDSALANGQDVEMPVETLVKLIQSETMRDVLYQDVRLTKGGLTPRQAQENMMQLGEEAKKIFDESLNDVGAERRVVLEKIQNDVANQLVAAGHSRQNASLEGQLWSAFVNATSERMGMDPDVFYERYKPRVMTSDRFGEVPKRITIPKTLPKRTVERQARVRQSGATQKRATFAPTTVTTDKPVIIQNRDRSRPGLVSQMHKIAASPNYQMVSFSRDFGNGAPVVAYGAVGENQLGREDFAVTAKGESIRVRYAVVEADSVLVSNNVDGTVNPEYNSADASRMRAIAGNGRIAGLQEAFNRNTTAQYVDAMKADAETTGIDSAVIDGMAKPILVRIMPTENVTPDIGDVSNTSTTAQLSDFQQANNDAERLNFDRITFTEDGAIDESSVIDFIQQMPVSEQDTLITKNGRPTQRAYDRLTYALIAKAYQDDELTQLATESTGDEAKNVFKALVAVAPKYVRLLDSEYDLRDVIAGVAHLAIDAQRKGVSLESHIGLSGDLDLGDAPAGRANVADPSTLKVAQEVAKVTRSYKSIQSLFGTIADEAFDEMVQADSNETDMFGGAVTRSREEVVDGAIQAYQSANAEAMLFQRVLTAEELTKIERKRKLDENVITVPVDGIQRGSVKTVLEQLQSWMADTLPVEVETEIGTVVIDEKSIKGTLNHGFGQKKLDTIFSLPDGMKNAVYLESIKDKDGKPIDNHFFAYKINYDGEDNIVFVRVRDDVNMNRLYVHEVYLESEMVNPSGAINTAAKLLRSKPHGAAGIYKAILREKIDFDNLEQYLQLAWHGTPHIFDQFTLDHIGSGEGAQAHGWGLYFTEDMAVAERYRNSLAGGEVRFKGRSITKLHRKLEDAREYGKLAIIEELMLKQSIYEMRIDAPSQIREEFYSQADWDWFESEVVPYIERDGRVFKVEIPETDEMLDEQKYFEDQSDYVQDRLKDAWEEIEYDYELEDLTGAEIYQAFVEHYGSPKEASLAMNEHGIEGITYDGSRDGRCYVVFDDKAIKVVEFLQDQKEQAEARGAYNPADRTISLFRKADMSTFLHESAHAFLDIMIDLTDMENSPADLKADVQTLMKWFGLKDAAEWKGLSFAQKTDYHEKFARGFESYLREGKAPSSGLRRAFARFKQWLVSLYQSATELNVDVTPEVKAVMDRMVASNKEINQAVSINRLANLWTQENFPGTPTQWEQYKELTKDADEMARAQHNASLVAELSFMRGRVVERRSQLDREYNEAYAKARQQAIDELNNDSIYQMIADFQGDDKPKLSIVEVAEIGNDQLQAVGAHGILADDGYSLEPMAQNYGYGDDVVAFVEAIAGSKPFDQAVEDRARQLMEEDNEELLTDQQRQESAELAALNDLTMRRVEEEYKIAAANKANANVRAAAKVWAEETIENTQVRLLDQNQYRVQAEKFARVAVQAAANHNAQAVAEAKRKQLVNLYAQRQSLMAKNRVRQTEKLARKINRTFKKKLRKGQQDQEFMDQVLGLMHRYGLLEGDYQTNRSFADFKKDFEDKQGVPLSMIEESLFTNAPVNYQDLTYAEFDSLRNAIDMLLHQGRRVRTVTREGQREAIEKIVEEMKTELVETFAQSKRDPNEESAFGRYIRDRMFDHMKLSNLIRKMVGGKDTSVMHQMILDPLNEAGDREVSMIREAAQKLNDLTNQKLGSESMTKKIRLNLSSGPKMLSRTTRLAIALNSGNQQNRDRLHSSKNGYTLGDINLILSSLTKSELEWVQGVWDLIDSFWPMLAEVERRTNGLPPQKVEAEPFNVTLGDGTVVAMRGGYYPIKYDRRLSIDAARNEMEAYGKDIIKGAFASATTKQGFAKERKNHVDLPLKLDLFVPGLHLKEVIHDICFRETLQTVNRLVRNKDFADLIEQRFGADYYESITKTLLAVASDGSGASANAMLGTALSYLKGNVTFAALSASVTTVFLQPLGILQSIQRIGLTNVLNGYVKLAKQGSLANIEKTCLDKSEFMRNRKFTMNAELNEIGRRLDRRNWKIARGVDAIEKVLFAPMQGVQLWMVDLATWYGAYEKARAEGNNDELAVKVANQTVRDAQGSGLILDQAKIQRDNPLFTIFYSYFNSTLNLAADSWRENVLKKKNAIGSLVFIRDLLMLTAVPQLATELIFSLLRGDDWEDREPEDWAKLGVSAATGSMLSMFVGLREVTGLLNGYSYSGPVVLRVFNDIDRCWDALTSEDPDAEKIAQRSISLLSNVIKIPATQINRTWKGIEAYMDGETDTPTSVLFGAPKDN